MHVADWVPDWVPDAVFYQVFPERFRNGNPSNDPPRTDDWGGTPTRENYFGGDLEGVIQSLDYLADLGVTALYLNPIFEAGSNHKYDAHDYLRIDPTFGDDAIFDRLVAELHGRGMRLVLDGVFNHCGLGFMPFVDLRERGASSRYRNWFDAYSYPLITEPLPNYATCGGAHYLPRLNTREPEVEAFVHGVALHWLERGIDGWRLDVPYEVDPGFWRRFRSVVKARYPDAYLLAEEWRDPSHFLHGDTFDGAMHYQLRDLSFDFLLKKALTGEAFGRALEAMQARLPAGTATGMLTLLGSHDTPRLLTACGGDPELAVLAFTLLYTLPGAPSLYYGDENGMQGGEDPGCRQTMEWEPDRWQPVIRDTVKRLIALRKEHACLRRGAFRSVFANDRMYVFERALEGGGGGVKDRALVVLNGTALPRDIDLPVPFPDGARLRDLLNGGWHHVTAGELRFRPLPERSALVLVPG